MFKKKIPNPELEVFVKELQKRGFKLVEGVFASAKICIKDTKDFLDYARNRNEDTIFRMADCSCICYFFPTMGGLVLLRIPTRVRE